MSSFNLTGTSLKGLFGKPACSMYPVKEPVYTEMTKGCIEVDMSLCILCGVCGKKCPSNSIVVDRGEGYWSIDRFSCIQCGNCVRSCPKDALRMDPAHPTPAVEKGVHRFEKPAEEPEEADEAVEPVDSSAPATTVESSEAAPVGSA